ncbi:ATP-binding cassette sub-family G member 2 [Aphelenchoides besseyi]|nr:ATP-binding cassette sub-family G member 2 [Aphelenchoides besseyi]
MEDGLRSKLLANDEISIEMEEAEEADASFHAHLPDQSSSRAKSEKTHSTVTHVPSMELSWENITVAPLENEERVYGIANTGEVLAILGPSGAGKTTLLNVLTQRNMSDLDVKGNIRINGISMGGSAIRRMSAYVQQNDLFIGTMTVKEHLTFMVDLRMARNYTKRQREKRVITRIGWPHRLKGISGGERKRLAFASEILTSPPILFCDEPTSGLDAFLALNVIEVLRNLAKQKGMTIVITIHQPSSQVFELFDKICLLVDGRNAFSGSTEQAIRHWKKLGEPLPQQFNPGDHFISTLDAGDNICDSFDQSEYGRNLLEAIRQSVSPQSSSSSASEVITKSIKKRQQYQASWIQQFVALTKRAFLVTVREPMLLRVRVFQTLITALILGIVYFDTPIRQSTIINVNGLLFITTSNMNFMFQFASVAYAAACIFTRVEIAIAVALTAAGMLTPGWRQIESKINDTIIQSTGDPLDRANEADETINMGLFSFLCTAPGQKSSSTASSRADAEQYCKDWWKNQPTWEKAVISLVILSLVVEVVALVYNFITFCCCCCRGHALKPLAPLATIAFVLLGVALAIYAVKNRSELEKNKQWKDLKDPSNAIGYSFFLECGALALLLLSIVVGSLSACFGDKCL